MANRIRTLRKAADLSMEDLADKVGTTASTINKLEKGQMRLTDKWVYPIADALGVGPGDLFAADSQPIDTPMNTRYLPVYGLAAGSITGTHRMDSQPVEYVASPSTLDHVRDAYALIVTGTSMEPRYFAGDAIFLHPHRPCKPGDHVVIQEERDGGINVSVKCLKAVTEKYIVTEQYNPPAEVKFLRERVQAMHRVLTPNEVAGL